MDNTVRNGQIGLSFPDVYYVLRLGNLRIPLGFERGSSQAVQVDTDRILQAIETLQGVIMDNFESLKSVLSDLSNAVDEQGNAVDAVYEKIAALETANQNGEDISGLIGDLRGQVDELSSNTSRLKQAASGAQSEVEPNPEPQDGDSGSTDTTGGETTGDSTTGEGTLPSVDANTDSGNTDSTDSGNAGGEINETQQ